MDRDGLAKGLARDHPGAYILERLRKIFVLRLPRQRLQRLIKRKTGSDHQAQMAGKDHFFLKTHPAENKTQLALYVFCKRGFGRLTTPGGETLLPGPN